jgi:NADPH:quinone reductase-like Zn-dependent oxidoreductase
MIIDDLLNLFMKALTIHEYGGPEELIYEEIPIPEFGPGEILVKVHATSVNPVDWKIREGHNKEKRPVKFPFILGWDVAGAVADTGSLVSRFKTGDLVFALGEFTRNGAEAEYISLKTDAAARVPTTISLEEAAAVPLTSLTAWMMLFDKANLQSGQRILIHAASGGVGSFAVQLAKIAGAYVTGTTSEANIDYVRSLGADEVINYKAEDFSEKIKNYDVVLDTIGGETQKKSFKVLKSGGILVTTVQPTDENLAKGFGITLQTGMVQPNGARLQEIAGLIDEGKIKVYVEKEFGLKETRIAQEYSQTGKVRGKLVVRV